MGIGPLNPPGSGGFQSPLHAPCEDPVLARAAAWS